jgi:hypothetical protein
MSMKVPATMTTAKSPSTLKAIFVETFDLAI